MKCSWSIVNTFVVGDDYGAKGILYNFENTFEYKFIIKYHSKKIFEYIICFELN